MYTFFGTSKDVSLGPTAILSLLTLTLIDGCGTPGDKESHAPCAVALTLFSGLVQLVCAVLNLGECRCILRMCGKKMYRCTVNAVQSLLCAP